MRVLLSWVSGLVLVATFSVIVIWCIIFRANCSGYLKRAADANSIEMALCELNTALAYIEKEGFTEGYTSVIYKTPDEDIGFWYANIKSSYEELSQIDPNATALEKSNALMKLRETLLDQGQKGERITLPSGTSRYPYNGLMGTILLLSATLFIISLLGAGYSCSIEITEE